MLRRKIKQENEMGTDEDQEGFAVLNRMSGKMSLEKVERGAMQTSGGEVFQAGGTACAKARAGSSSRGSGGASVAGAG